MKDIQNPMPGKEKDLALDSYSLLFKDGPGCDFLNIFSGIQDKERVLNLGFTSLLLVSVVNPKDTIK